MALDISNAFDRVWHAGLLQKLKSYGISGQIFGFISSFLSNRQLEWFWMESLHKKIQLMLEFLKAPILGPTLLLLYISDIPDDVIKHLICGNNSNWLLNLILIYKKLWTGIRSGLLISVLGKINWLHLTSLITMVLLM